MLESINTPDQGLMVTPVVSCPTLSVIVLSWVAIARCTLSKDFSFACSNWSSFNWSSSSLPSPAAKTISYSPKTSWAFNFLARALALSTRFNSQKVWASSWRSSGVENGYFSCLVRASRKRSTASSYTNLPFSLVLKNSLRSKAGSTWSPSSNFTFSFNSSAIIADTW